MKKRYIASPILLLAIATTWNIALRAKTPVATAEELHKYTAPQTDDPRHPLEVFVVDVAGGETESAVLAKLPTTLYPEDRVSFVVDPAFGLGTIVHVRRALPVTVQDGRKVVKVRTWANTVEELLDDINRPLADLDKANYNASDSLEVGMTIKITRVSKSTLVRNKVVPFATVEKQDPNEYRGVTKVAQTGENGEKAETYEITRTETEDGYVTRERLVKTEVTKKPQEKIIVHGSKLKIGKVATGSASWYDLCCTKVASTTFKKGTVLRVTNLTTGKQIEVTVDDTGAFGPAHGNNRVLDLNPVHFKALGGTLGQGIMQNIKAEEILNP